MFSNLCRWKKEQELNEAAKIVVDTQQVLEDKDTQLKIAKDLAERKEILGELLGPLNGDKKTVMRELLESVQTDKLQNAFDKYLPAVMDSGKVSSKKETLIESKTQKQATEITGDKSQAHPVSEEKTAEIFDIRRLAGLKV